MTVTLLYFAALRDLVGRVEEVRELPAGVTTVRHLGAYLEDAVPGLKGRLGPVRFARNEAFAAADDRLEEGDVVALIPPVAGG